jgi:membrane-bound inhibitor of C-type lysozyme
MRAFFAASAFLALAACDKPASTPAALPPPPPLPTASAAPVPAPAPVNEPVVVANYLCVGGKTVEAGYPTPTSALVIWQGRAYTLTQASAASGGRYTGSGLQWWSKSLTDAVLSTLKPGEEIASGPGMTCTVQLASATTPAPGMPGGLPAGTPLVPEVGPGSAQGAAEVVRTYYALLSKRNSVLAATYRADGTPENLSQYATLDAQVGAPGAITGAGNTLTVEVPVALSGRMADGSALKKSGKAVLKRANDGPSSTPEQRTWRIDRISLK